jgi:hypothetical protein
MVAFFSCLQVHLQGPPNIYNRDKRRSRLEGREFHGHLRPCREISM